MLYLIRIDSIASEYHFNLTDSVAPGYCFNDVYNIYGLQNVREL